MYIYIYIYNIYTYIHMSGFPIVVGPWGAPLHLMIYFENSPPHQNQSPHGMKPPT